jgi:hypothetical protein
MIPQFMAKIATKTIWDLGVHNTQGTAEDSQKAHQKYQKWDPKNVSLRNKDRTFQIQTKAASVGST